MRALKHYSPEDYMKQGETLWKEISETFKPETLIVADFDFTDFLVRNIAEVDNSKENNTEAHANVTVPQPPPPPPSIGNGKMPLPPPPPAINSKYCLLKFIFYAFFSYFRYEVICNVTSPSPSSASIKWK